MTKGISENERKRRKEGNRITTKINLLAWLIEVKTGWFARLNNFPYTLLKISCFIVGIGVIAAVLVLVQLRYRQENCFYNKLQIIGLAVAVLPSPLPNPLRFLLKRFVYWNSTVIVVDIGVVFASSISRDLFNSRCQHFHPHWIYFYKFPGWFAWSCLPQFIF